jgi:exosortase
MPLSVALAQPKVRTLSFCIIFLASLGYFWTPLCALATLSLRDDRYSYNLAIPLLSLFLLGLKKNDIWSNAHYSPKMGILLLLLGGLAFLFRVDATPSTATNSLAVLILTMAAVWSSGFILCVGTSNLRVTAFPLCFLILMVPLPIAVIENITTALQRASADVSYATFHLVGIPTLRQGYHFLLPGIEVEVAKQCSGIKSGSAFLTATILASWVFLRSPWARVGLISFTIPLIILKNAARIVTISALAIYVDRSLLYSSLHRLYGGLVFSVPAFGILVAIIFVLRRIETRSVKAKPGRGAVFSH